MKRQANTIVELLAAVVIVSTVMLILGQLRVVVRGQLRAARQQRTAVIEVTNVMEQAMATSWEQLSQDSANMWHLSPDARKRLPDGKLTASIIEQQDTVPAKRIALEVRWSQSRGRQTGRVQLVAWRHHTSEKLP